METFERYAASDNAGLQRPKLLYVALDEMGKVAKQSGDLELLYGKACRIVLDVPKPIELTTDGMPETAMAYASGIDVRTDASWVLTFYLPKLQPSITSQPPRCPAMEPAFTRYYGTVVVNDNLEDVLPIEDGMERGKLHLLLKTGSMEAQLNGHLLRTAEYTEMTRPRTIAEILREHAENSNIHFVDDEKERIFILSSCVDSVSSGVDRLSSYIEAKISGVDSSLDSMRISISGVDGRIDNLRNRIEAGTIYTSRVDVSSGSINFSNPSSDVLINCEGVFSLTTVGISFVDAGLSRSIYWNKLSTTN